MARTRGLVLSLALVPLHLAAAQAISAERDALEGGPYPAPERVGPCLTDEARADILAELLASRARLRDQGVLTEPRAGEHVRFGWPLRNLTFDPGVHGISNFVDLDPDFPDALLDYQCGTRSYDTASGYNHQGIDVFTWPFGWYKMDFDQVEIVAVADGIIIHKSDGHDDRSCGFDGGTWNAVYVEHADGSIAWYGHMKEDSTTPKAVGQSVVRGEYLGVVGSSGNSTGPHLHLETYDGSGSLIEPYDGPCNHLNPDDSWWESQRPYYDSAINAVHTHSAYPEFPACPLQEVLNLQDSFDPGDRVTFAAYYRDQLEGQVSTYRIYDPDGSLFDSWTHGSPADHYAASWWAWWTILPLDAPEGIWRFEVEFEGQVASRPFAVGMLLDADGPTLSPPTARILTPNPIPAGVTRLRLELPAGGATGVDLFSVTGRHLATLAEEPLAPGVHELPWPEGGANDGVRFLRVTTASGRTIHKIVRAP
jgi:murein DD-endopeptidase MepM/ murein hydrolase activator NlpD